MLHAFHKCTLNTLKLRLLNFKREGCFFILKKYYEFKNMET